MVKRRSNFSSNPVAKAGTDHVASRQDVQASAVVASHRTEPSVISTIALDVENRAAYIKRKRKSNFNRQNNESTIVGFNRRRRLVRRINEEGQDEFLLMLPSSAGGETSADLSFLLAYPNLIDPVSDALLSIAEAEDNEAVTVINKARSLHGAGKFFGYLKEFGRFDFALSDLTTQEVNAFIVWLDGLENWKPISKHTTFFAMRRVFAWLQESAKWKVHMDPRMQFPMNPWKGVQADSIQAALMVPMDELAAIYQACCKEVTEKMSRVTAWRAAMETAASSGHTAITTVQTFVASNRWAKAVNPYMDYGVLFATLRHHNLHLPVPSHDRTKEISKHLLAAVDRHGGLKLVQECFYPSYRSLVPFILLMAIHLYYNQATLLGSKVTDYNIKKNILGRDEFLATLETIDEEADADETVSDAETLVADPVKARAAGKRQMQVRPVTDDADNPATIWKFIVEWTKWIRPLAIPAQRDNLFLAFTSGTGASAGSQAVRSFWCNSKQLPGGQTWKQNLQSFYRNNNLPYHPFKRFRTTALDMVEMLYGGDIRKQAAAGVHATTDVVFRSYTTIGQMMRGDEALAWVGLWRQRWRETSRKIDPRSLPVNADICAATPGWKCVDPFSGPFITEVGKPCKAYGSCPICPHAGIDENDPYACAQAFNLLDAIDQAADEIDPVAWKDRWEPVRSRLVGGWIPIFPESVLNEAKALDLSRLPPLE